MRWILALTLAAVTSCSGLPPVEFCYEHPVYGKVCVAVGGKKFYDPKLTPEQRAEVEKWIAASEAARP
jgi:hypothetical protein